MIIHSLIYILHPMLLLNCFVLTFQHLNTSNIMVYKLIYCINYTMKCQYRGERKMEYNEVLDLWITEKRTEIRNSSYKNYSYTITNRVKPQLGKYDISEITRMLLQNYIYDLSKILRQESVINVTKVLSQSLNFAVDRGYISTTPYKRIKIPKDKEIKEMKVFKAEEIKRILSTPNYSQQKKDIVNIAFRTGMRIGEILVLKWDDVNFEQNFIMIRRTLSSYNNKEPEICEPKTKGSKRRIDCDSLTMELLNRIKKRNTFEYVFCKDDGTILSRQAIYQSFVRMCKVAGV